MDEQARISYETIGGDSYLTAAYDMDRVVNYQVQMLSSNEIEYLLSVSKRQKDEEVRLYYGITSRVTLSQILSRRKLTRQEFLNLVDRMGKAVLEVREYQLPGCGLVFDPDYIFVKSEPLEASFVYLPLYKKEENADFLKNAVRDLVMQGMVEMSSDNFIQIILNTLADDAFRAEKLVQCVKQLMGAGQNTGGAVRSAGLNQQSGAGMQTGAAIPSTPPKKPGTPGPGTPGPSAPVVPEAVKMPPKKEAAAKPEKQKREKEKAEKSGGGTSKKQKMVLVQAVVMVILAACASFNVFMDVDGNLLSKNILAIVILLAGTEVIAYREIFVNSKEKESKPKKEGKNPAKPVNRNVNIPGKKTAPAMNSNVPPQAAGTPYGRTGGTPGAAAGSGRQTPYAGSTPPPVQTPVQPAAVPGFGSRAGNSLETENTVLVDDQAMTAEPYLEYYDNGVLKRVILNKQSTLVGRLTSQVDFSVTSLKVGKMHAEFINENGSFFVRDLNSKNGTYVNESKERIQPNNLYPLQNGDRIALADCVFTLRCSR